METGLAGCPRRIRTRRCRIRTQSPAQKPGNRVEKSGNGPRLVGFTPPKLTSAHCGQMSAPRPHRGLEAIEAAPPSWAVTLALGENPREVALVNKTTELGNISELAPRIL